jgi:hypothetical protein
MKRGKFDIVNLAGMRSNEACFSAVLFVWSDADGGSIWCLFASPWWSAAAYLFASSLGGLYLFDRP